MNMEKEFEEFWKNESEWYNPNEPDGLAEKVLARKTWEKAMKLRMNNSDLYAEHCCDDAEWICSCCGKSAKIY